MTTCAMRNEVQESIRAYIKQQLPDPIPARLLGHVTAFRLFTRSTAFTFI